MATPSPGFLPAEAFDLITVIDVDQFSPVPVTALIQTVNTCQHIQQSALAAAGGPAQSRQGG